MQISNNTNKQATKEITMKKSLNIGLAITTVFLLGCATFPEKDNKSTTALTAGNVKTKITKGITTQAEILNVFGSPNLVTRNREGKEIWNYNRMNYTTKSGSDGSWLIFYGGSRAITTATTKSFDLMITFDERDTVIDYSIIQANY